MTKRDREICISRAGAAFQYKGNSCIRERAEGIVIS